MIIVIAAITYTTNHHKYDTIMIPKRCHNLTSVIAVIAVAAVAANKYIKHSERMFCITTSNRKGARRQPCKTFSSWEATFHDLLEVKFDLEIRPPFEIGFSWMLLSWDHVIWCEYHAILKLVDRRAGRLVVHVHLRPKRGVFSGYTTSGMPERN